MKNKNWILGLVIVVAAIVALGIWGFKSNTDQSVSGAQTEVLASYFDDSANVMYFYQDDCSWCIKQKEILNQLGQEGYRFKSMNIGSNYPDHQSWWKDYDVSGTPTFVAKNGDHLEGYQSYEKLKAFLDAHK